ncbi:MAG: C39 family peptidase [Patescibacteria group bacterium]|nr:C39 family peptidase [Patescibacteria group bacterium]
MKSLIFLISVGLFLPGIVFAAATSTEIVKLSVPFIIEIPDGTWTGPWKNACEEASTSMVDQYYQGVTKVGRQDSKKIMWPLFTYQDSVWGSNADSNASRTVKIVEANLDFTATIKRHPTVEEIKNELRHNRPVISFHYAKYLANPQHRFRVNGSYFHVMVISGFDEAKKEFIVEDGGAENGLDYRYSYDMLMGTLADFNHATGKTYDLPTVIFTAQNLLAKAVGSNRVYFVQNNVKHYISHPDVFKTRGWKWSKVHIVNKAWLDSLTKGEMITN